MTVGAAERFLRAVETSPAEVVCRTLDRTSRAPRSQRFAVGISGRRIRPRPCVSELGRNLAGSDQYRRHAEGRFRSRCIASRRPGRWDASGLGADEAEGELAVLPDHGVLGEFAVLPVPRGNAHAEVKDRVGRQAHRRHVEDASIDAGLYQSAETSLVPVPRRQHPAPVWLDQAADLPVADESFEPVPGVEADMGLE